MVRHRHGRHHDAIASTGFCPPCGTVSHSSRAAAQQFLRSSGLSPTRNLIITCPISPGRFHIVDRPGDDGTSATVPTQGAAMTSTISANATTADLYANGASAYLDELLTDLDTYRYVEKIPVTPALARRLIELDFENNRHLKPRLKERLTKDMEHGDWREETGQTVKISKTGKLLDGKHRMHAVVASGMTIPFDLCFGIPDRNVIAIDTGSNRTTADSVKIAGGKDLYRTDSIIRWIYAWDRGWPMGPSGGHAPTAIETEREYQRDPDGFDTAAARGYDCLRRKLGPASVPGIGYYLIARVDKEGADDFYDKLVSGNYGLADPTKMSVYCLREALRIRDRLTRPEMLALIIIAWNRRHETVKKFQLPRDGISNRHFPTPEK